VNKLKLCDPLLKNKYYSLIRKKCLGSNHSTTAWKKIYKKLLRQHVI